MTPKKLDGEMIEALCAAVADGLAVQACGGAVPASASGRLQRWREQAAKTAEPNSNLKKLENGSLSAPLRRLSARICSGSRRLVLRARKLWTA